MGFALDVYSSLKILLVGDFKVREEEYSLQDFLEEFDAKHLVKEVTCFKQY